MVIAQHENENHGVIKTNLLLKKKKKNKIILQKFKINFKELLINNRTVKTLLGKESVMPCSIRHTRQHS